MADRYPLRQGFPRGGRSTRIFAWCLLVAGAGLGLLAVRALSGVDDQARFIAEVAEGMGQPIDASQWSWRWRISWIGLAIVAAGGVLSGLSLLTGRPSGWVVLGAALAGNAVWLLVATGGQREYAFEATVTQIVSTAALAAVCGWAACRARRHARSKG
jgi:hypothetical protein